MFPRDNILLITISKDVDRKCMYNLQRLYPVDGDRVEMATYDAQNKFHFQYLALQKIIKTESKN